MTEESEGDTPSRAEIVRRKRRRLPFLDRADAGRELAERLRGFAAREDCLVLALPQGGVPVAYEIARRLRLPLDVLVSRALGVPGHEEQAFGAIGADSGAVLDYALIRAARLTHEQVASALDGARAELKRRSRVLRDGRKPLDLTGKTVILVDDGAATGAALFAGIHLLKRMRPAQVVLAMPVCPAAACALLEREADLLLALQRPADFYAMPQFYLQFRSLSDEDVLPILEANERGVGKRACGRKRNLRSVGATNGKA